MTLPAGDGLPLRAFFLPHPLPKARLLLLNGRADFLEKWASLFAELHAMGFALASFDWRGQGGSAREIAGDAGHIDRFETWLDDLDVLLPRIGEALPGPAPWLALGHSMGGHLLLRWLAARRAGATSADFAPRGAILTAPFVGFAMAPPLALLVERLAAFQVARGRGTRFALGQGPWGPHRESPARMAILTSDRAQFEDEGRWIRANPALATGGVTWGWLAAAFESHRALARVDLSRLDLPLLILLAGRERLVSNRAAMALAARLPRAELAVLPEAAHEILRESPQLRAQALSRIGAFAARALA